MGVRHQIWDLLEVTHDLETRSPVVDWYDKSLAILIVLNVLAVIVESVEGEHEVLFLLARGIAGTRLRSVPRMRFGQFLVVVGRH
jgi:hypothetical protein